VLNRLFSLRNRATTLAVLASVLSIVLGLVFLTVETAAAVGLVVLGVLLLAISGTANRWEHLVVRVLGVSLDASLAMKEHGPEFAEAARNAPDSALEAVIPLLRQDVASDVLEVAGVHADKRLIDPELSWLRQELNVTVFAVHRPGDNDRWSAGGAISTLSLPEGTRLAVLGDRADIENARQRLAAV
jgi:hypothetical protein